MWLTNIKEKITWSQTFLAASFLDFSLTLQEAANEGAKLRQADSETATTLQLSLKEAEKLAETLKGEKASLIRKLEGSSDQVRPEPSSRNNEAERQIASLFTNFVNWAGKSRASQWTNIYVALFHFMCSPPHTNLSSYKKHVQAESADHLFWFELSLRVGLWALYAFQACIAIYSKSYEIYS